MLSKFVLASDYCTDPELRNVIKFLNFVSKPSSLRYALNMIDLPLKLTSLTEYLHDFS